MSSLAIGRPFDPKTDCRVDPAQAGCIDAWLFYAAQLRMNALCYGLALRVHPLRPAVFVCSLCGGTRVMQPLAHSCNRFHSLQTVGFRVFDDTQQARRAVDDG
jgi:hypothetical protein